jgi:hypothetical protein
MSQSRLEAFNRRALEASVQQDSRQAAQSDEDRLGDLPPQQQAERHDRDGGSGQIGDCLAGQHYNGARDCSGCCCGGALDEGLDLRVVAMADEPPPGDGDAEVDRDEDRYRGDRTALSNAATSLAQTVYLLALDELFRRETGCLHPKGLAAQEARKRSA